MEIFTAGKIMTLGPCENYTREQVESLMGDGLTLIEILDHPDVPIYDRLWVGARLAPAHVVKTWALDCVERVLPIYEARYPQNRHLRNVVETARAYLRGEATLNELEGAAEARCWTLADATERAVLATMQAASWSSRMLAASSVAGANAADSILRTRAWEVAWAAVRVVWTAAPSMVEQAWQLERLRELVIKEDGTNG